MAESAEIESDTFQYDPLSGRSPDLPGSLSILAGAAGFEPTMPVSETGALTAWPHPNMARAE